MREVLIYLIGSVREYLRSEIDIDAFREAFVSSYHYIRSNGSELDSANAHALAGTLMVPFADFSAGSLSEEAFRRALKNAIRPFAWAEQGSAKLSASGYNAIVCVRDARLVTIRKDVHSSNPNLWRVPTALSAP